jgi:hypothetical protein
MLWTSTDGGATFTRSLPPLPAGTTMAVPKRIQYDPAKTMLAGLATTSGGETRAAIWESTDAGATWSSFLLDTPAGWLHAEVTDLAIDGSCAVLLGRSWDGLGNETPTLWEWNGSTSTPHDLNELVSGTPSLQLVTAARVVCEGDTLTIVGTGRVPAGRAVAGGHAYVLRSTVGGANDVPFVAGAATVTAAPNPFTEETRFSFDLPHDGSVRVTIYDTLGRFVTTIEEGRRVAGPQTVTWSGRNSAGRAVVPGVYYAQVTAGQRIGTVKIVRWR